MAKYEIVHEKKRENDLENEGKVSDVAISKASCTVSMPQYVFVIMLQLGRFSTHFGCLFNYSSTSILYYPSSLFLQIICCILV